MAQAEQTMKHEIFTNVVNIPKFSGEPDDIDLDNYIAVVETYIINKGINDDKQKIEAFKAKINPDRGIARTIIRYRNFIEDLKTYKEYISEFRKHFSRASDSESLRIIVRCLELVQKPNEGDTEFIARLDSFSKQLEETLT